MEFVTVIVPVYNAEKYIERCIDSLMKQTYTCFEILFVNDGSTDCSKRIIEKYIKRIENEGEIKTRIIDKDNKGAPYARNVGIDNAQGDYICFVDADDYVHPKYIEILLETCLTNKCEMALSGHVDFYEKGIPKTDEYEINRMNIRIETPIEVLNDIYTELSVNTIVPWGKMYKKELFEGIRYPVGHICEDEATTHRIIYNAKRIVRIDAILYYYFVGSESVMRGEYTLKQLDVIWEIEQRMQFYKENGLEELYYKDAYKYLCKILIHYNKVNRMQERHRDVIRQLRIKYKGMLEECKDCGWSIKRVLAMKFFSFFPKMYVFVRRNN